MHDTSMTIGQKSDDWILAQSNHKPDRRFNFLKRIFSNGKLHEEWDQDYQANNYKSLYQYVEQITR